MREERLNIWEALLNLEYKYGDEDTQAQTLQNALTYNDKKLVYLIVIKIHTQANNHKVYHFHHGIPPASGNLTFCHQLVLATCWMTNECEVGSGQLLWMVPPCFLVCPSQS